MTETLPPIQAITFDFWRTLFYAGSNLPERRRERVRIVTEVSECSEEEAKDALKHVTQEFLRVHIAEQRTLEPRDAVALIEKRVATRFSGSERAELGDALADAFLTHPPEPIPGSLEAVGAAAARVPVGIISDTGLTPGSRIERLLDSHGFLDHVHCLSFSDEVGAAKPRREMFEHASQSLKVEGSALLHIGDLEPTDVRGALDFGARAGLFSGDNDRYVEGSQAHFVFESWEKFVDALPGILGG